MPVTSTASQDPALWLLSSQLDVDVSIRAALFVLSHMQRVIIGPIASAAPQVLE